MRRWNAFLVAWTLAIACVSNARAQDPDSARSLTARQKWARFAVVRGRVSVFITRGQGGAAWTEEKPGGVSESFGICCESGTVKLRFERRTPDETVLMQFFSAREFVLTRMPNADHVVPLHFVQPKMGDVRLTIGNGDQGQSFAAPTLWHLLLLEPELCQRELLPLMRQLRHDWRLDEQMLRLQQQLLTCDDAAAPPAWEKCVAQLRDPRYQVRQAADRQLRRMGQSVLPMLESMDPARLDNEQRMRLSAICDALSNGNEDVPQQIAAWIVNDKRLWQRLNSSQDDVWRSTAERHLARLQHTVPAENRQLAANEKESN